MTKRSTEKRDLYAEVTDSIVSSLETAGEWERPWTLVGGDALSPRNAVTHKRYRGVNVLLLWAESMKRGYTSGEWATFKQWFREREATDEERANGVQLNRNGKVTTRCVRKGETSTMVTLWKPFDRKATQADVDSGAAKKVGDKVRALLLRNYNVFAAEQVEGYELPEREALPERERDDACEEFFSAIGADLRVGGDMAAYAPVEDYIICPSIEQFATSEHYYATLAHEHGHWTGHKTRLDRDLSGRFGNASYAAEELIAELTAAFVGAMLGFHPTTRDDHAAYVKHWIRLLSDDKRAIITAASKAQAAADYLAKFSAPAEDENDETEEDEAEAA
jgi:antirestriction protein ArdC